MGVKGPDLSPAVPVKLLLLAVKPYCCWCGLVMWLWVILHKLRCPPPQHLIHTPPPTLDTPTNYPWPVCTLAHYQHLSTPLKVTGALPSPLQCLNQCLHLAYLTPFLSFQSLPILKTKVLMDL